MHGDIPLSLAMGTRVLLASPHGVTLEAPLPPNENHRATAFGGSVSALAILAGWALVDLRLRVAGRPARTVIQRSSVSYLHPIADTFRAHAASPEALGWDRLLRSLERWGRGRIQVEVEVSTGGTVAARMDADYVVLPLPG